MTEPLTVTALTMALKGLLEDAFPGVLVKGEITNWRPAASGHVYFSLKDATAQVQLVNGQATVAYTVRVKNNGPNQAHNVQLVDSAPSGVTFTGITQAPVGGGCSLSGGVLLQCSLGTLGPGVERVIGLSARVTQTGTYVNCATATGDGKDTNGANNRACASTLVTAPVTPPTISTSSSTVT